MSDWYSEHDGPKTPMRTVLLVHAGCLFWAALALLKYRSNEMSGLAVPLLMGFPGLVFSMFGLFRSPTTWRTLTFVPWFLLFLAMVALFVVFGMMVSH